MYHASALVLQPFNFLAAVLAVSVRLRSDLSLAELCSHSSSPSNISARNRESRFVSRHHLSKGPPSSVKPGHYIDVPSTRAESIPRS